MAQTIPHRAYVELTRPNRLPVGVGRWVSLEPGLRGYVSGHGYGGYKYVRFADGNEGPVPVDDLTVIRKA